MAEPEPRDDPEYMKNFPDGFLYYDITNTCFLKEDRDSNLEEESTKINPELCDDVFARKPQVKDSASCSAINEATKKTYASSSRNRDTSESGEIRRVGDKEDDRKESDDECDLYKRFHEIESNSQEQTVDQHRLQVIETKPANSLQMQHHGALITQIRIEIVLSLKCLK
ncbi:hypothetical protein ISN45_Aa06g036710 [Arabidopsis thaliana x Arabidopsis arenosa]|uniref:Uncharacterized protein n=1 Tax=Arabidopsis thaliana x Arabidopsis arenosa TaxID=1240361 RepID=A0A8T1Z4F8_9BRAS|nr:hypothetical protein ISN45_Aa06g036710 [Arabidopsis thaliana x Arabidopsis arenosa]